MIHCLYPYLRVCIPFFLSYSNNSVSNVMSIFFWFFICSSKSPSTFINHLLILTLRYHLRLNLTPKFFHRDSYTINTFLDLLCFLDRHYFRYPSCNVQFPSQSLFQFSVFIRIKGIFKDLPEFGPLYICHIVKFYIESDVTLLNFLVPYLLS